MAFDLLRLWETITARRFQPSAFRLLYPAFRNRAGFRTQRPRSRVRRTAGRSRGLETRPCRQVWERAVLATAVGGTLGNAKGSHPNRAGAARVTRRGDLPWSPGPCRERGVCPSGAGRRMLETAAFLVDRVLPRTPVRHWVRETVWKTRYGHPQPRHPKTMITLDIVALTIAIPIANAHR